MNKLHQSCAKLRTICAVVVILENVFKKSFILVILMLNIEFQLSIMHESLHIFYLGYLDA